MADYQVGSKGGKDRYMVGWNGDGKAGYKVGGGGSAVGQASNKALGGGGMDPVVGSKSAFSYSEPDTKDPGDKSDNMNFGGANSTGTPKNTLGAGGEVDLVYSEKGDWSAAKDAMSRRKAMADAARQYGGSKQYDSPTVDLVNIK